MCSLISICTIKLHARLILKPTKIHIHMAKPNEKLAESLEILLNLQNKNGVAIKNSEISRRHKERLVKNGFIKEVAKGWFISTNPGERPGDTTSWYISYWQFCARYLSDKYGDDYCISAEQSVLIHSGNNTVPNQLIIRSPKAPNKIIELLHNTSLYEMKSTLPNVAETTVVNGIRMLTLTSALIHCSQIMYKKNAIDMMSALSLISDSSQILAPLLDGAHVKAAGVLAGAFRNLGQVYIADQIMKTMKIADYVITETNPFDSKPPIKLAFREQSPYANRIKLMWHSMRQVVLRHFPKTPGIPKDYKKYLQSIDEIYVTDAYHSLSIERYVVSVELIEKVKNGEYCLKNKEDRDQRNAMAAQGYWLTAKVVKSSIELILGGANGGETVHKDHGEWYQMLFSPNVTAGLLKASDTIGYRNHQVYIGQSKHVPLSKEAIRDTMPVLFELLENEEDAGVRAVLGHFIFVFIHPYMDGNGRIARFLMNTMLASGGYPWTVIPVEERETYMNALEKASVDGDIEPFAIFISYLVQQSLNGTPVAKLK